MRPNEKKKERDGGVLYYQTRTKKNFLVESRETRRDEMRERHQLTGSRQARYLTPPSGSSVITCNFLFPYTTTCPDDLFLEAVRGWKMPGMSVVWHQLPMIALTRVAQRPLIETQAYLCLHLHLLSSTRYPTDLVASFRLQINIDLA